MTARRVYSLYGCPCGWHYWTGGPHPRSASSVQELHDQERPDCPHTEPVMLVDVAQGGVRT